MSLADPILGATGVCHPVAYVLCEATASGHLPGEYSANPSIPPEIVMTGFQHLCIMMGAERGNATTIP